MYDFLSLSNLLQLSITKHMKFVCYGVVYKK